jgi:hypothetical protein
MREFESGRSRAAALSLAARILYSTFAALTFAGLWSCVAIYDSIVHFDARATPADLYQRLVEHHRVMDRQKLLETAHAHLFMMPVLLLVAGHLFLLANLPQRVRTAGVVIGCVTMTLHLLAPWLIVWSGGAAAATLVYPISGGFLLLSMAVMLAVPVWQMWKS